MNFLISDAHAQAAGGAAGGAGGLSQILMLVVFVVIFYFLLIRPQQKKRRNTRPCSSKLAAGDEVVTAGGILGRIIEVGDSFVTIEIADGVRIKVQKCQITSLVPKGTSRAPESAMLEFARWKYILVAVVMLLALVFALPNFFGDDRALQVARKDRAAIDATGQQARRDAAARARRAVQAHRTSTTAALMVLFDECRRPAARPRCGEREDWATTTCPRWHARRARLRSCRSDRACGPCRSASTCAAASTCSTRWT